MNTRSNDPLVGIEATNERLERLESENAWLKRENAAMSDDLAMWKAKREVLREENAKLRAENARLKRAEGLRMAVKVGGGSRWIRMEPTMNADMGSVSVPLR